MLQPRIGSQVFVESQHLVASMQGCAIPCNFRTNLWPQATCPSSAQGMQGPDDPHDLRPKVPTCTMEVRVQLTKCYPMRLRFFSFAEEVVSCARAYLEANEVMLQHYVEDEHAGTTLFHEHGQQRRCRLRVVHWQPHFMQSNSFYFDEGFSAARSQSCIGCYELI